MRPCWIIQVSPKTNGKCPYKRYEERKLMKKRKPQEDESRPGNDTSFKECLEPQKLEDAGKDSPLELSEGAPGPTNTLILDFGLRRGSISPKFVVICY